MRCTAERTTVTAFDAAEGALNIPLGQTFAARVSGYYVNRESKATDGETGERLAAILDKYLDKQ